MMERRKAQRSRSLRGGKILFNNKQSVITCTVRNVSEGGANLHVESPQGVPAFFDLVIDGEAAHRSCDVVWKTPHRIGVVFCPAGGAHESPTARQPDHQHHDATTTHSLRGDLLSLRLALDQMPLGIVLLDKGLRAQFINHAFRTMWQLPDAKAESRPAFVTLMYHGRDTHAYDVADDQLDTYIQGRVARVRAGDPTPIDLRLTSGDIIRFQCTKLPDGGRMLSYTDVTDIVARTDELERLRGALDAMEDGIILLDSKLNVEFMNVAVRRQWQLPDDYAARKLTFPELVGNARKSNTFGMSDEPLELYIAQRISRVRAGDPRPMDIRHADGRIVRSHCSILPNGGRMLCYVDVTDLVRRADDARKFATGP